ncbi:MAG: type II toxin-antitoxin system RelE/ParE family toxin [Ginsengibacter sp.]
MSFKILTTLEFEKEIKKLAKKYPSLKKDYFLFLNSLKQNPLQGVSLGNNIYKIRLLISSKRTGKSGGARVISYLKIVDKELVLISIYDKSERANITDKEIKERLKRYLT